LEAEVGEGREAWVVGVADVAVLTLGAVLALAELPPGEPWHLSSSMSPDSCALARCDRMGLRLAGYRRLPIAWCAAAAEC
jgi:hypothetical protein